MALQKFESAEELATRTSLRPVLIAVFAAKFIVAAFLLANVAIPSPVAALAEQGAD